MTAPPDAKLPGTTSELRLRQLLIKTMTLGWKRKKNHDLWAELDRLAAFHQINWQWVRGHNGHPENEACDALAQRAASVASSLGGSRRGL